MPDPAGPWPDGLRIVTATDATDQSAGADSESEVLDAEVIDDDQLEITPAAALPNTAGGAGR